ncbi:metal-dependent hydrolase [Thermococcus sp.]
MPNYDTHVLSGIASYPIAVAVAGVLSAVGVPFKLTTMALILGYAVYVLGSDLPDMDHPDALIHRGTKPLVAVAVGSAVFIRIYSYINISSQNWINLTLTWGIAAAVAFASWYVFTAIMPKHRGIVHSLLFALIYGGTVFALVHIGIKISYEESLFVGFAAFSGYTLHLILDRDMALI